MVLVGKVFLGIPKHAMYVYRFCKCTLDSLVGKMTLEKKLDAAHYEHHLKLAVQALGLRVE